MNISFLHKPLGCLLFVLLLFVLASTIVSCVVDVVQVNIIKRFSPDYKTWAEAAKEKGEERQKIAEKEAKRIADEIAEENKEDLDRREMSKRVDTRKIENNLKEKGYIFRVRSFYVLDNFVWACGDFLVHKVNARQDYCCLAMVGSEDGGNDYKLLKIFEEIGRVRVFGSGLHEISMLFLEKNNGYLSIFGAEYDGRAIIYKTNDGGYTWNITLNTKNIPIIDSRIKKIRVINQNICLIISSQRNGDPRSIESNDSGKSWVYKHDDEEVFKTSNKGLTWETIKKEK